MSHVMPNKVVLSEQVGARSASSSLSVPPSVSARFRGAQSLIHKHGRFSYFSF